VEHATDDSPFRGCILQPIPLPAGHGGGMHAVESLRCNLCLIERRAYWPGLYSTNKG
jgi:hypothetical protein